MKLLSLTIVVALAIATVDLVSAQFLPNNLDNSYDNYCTDNGARKAEPHVCFHSSYDITGTVSADSQFEGFVSASDPTSKSTLSSFS